MAKNRENYVTFYLDTAARTKLEAMAKSSGLNRSQLIRNLIEGADGKREAKLAKLVGQMADLLSVR
jgi:hypothetical protein